VRGKSPPTGSCAWAPHGDRAGRQRRQVSDGRDYPSLPADPTPCPAGGSPGGSQAHSSAPRRSRASIRDGGLQQQLPAELQPSATTATCALNSSRPPGRGSRGFISRPPALRPRPFPEHPPRTPPLAPHRGCRLPVERCACSRGAPLSLLPGCPGRARTSPAAHVHFTALARCRKRSVPRLLSRAETGGGAR